jgi:lipopolysaccharide transport system ATP-binding protein
MSKKEIQSKFDEIVDFSGCDLYIDTPTKRYSSGMTVRLGFAVAAFLDPEILVVDEVLAVGDAEFQKKAIGKMKEVSTDGGRTVLFVSHNMASINSLCTSAMIMEYGKVKAKGETTSIIRNYLSDNNLNSHERWFNYEHELFQLKHVRVRNSERIDNALYRDLEMIFDFDFLNKVNKGNIYFILKFKSESGEYFLNTRSNKDVFIIGKEDTHVSMIVPAGFFNDGTYIVELMIHNYTEEEGYSRYFHETDFLQLEILAEKRPIGVWMGKEEGQVRHEFKWIK